MRITEADYNNWWLSPVGAEVKSMLRERIARINDEALTEGVVRDQMKMAEYLGRKLEIMDLLQMTYDELMGD